MKRRSKNRGKRKKKEISLDRLFQYIMGRKMNKSERSFCFGLKIMAQSEEEKVPAFTSRSPPENQSTKPSYSILATGTISQKLKSAAPRLLCATFGFIEAQNRSSQRKGPRFAAGGTDEPAAARVSRPSRNLTPRQSRRSPCAPMTSNVWMQPGGATRLNSAWRSTIGAWASPAW